MKNQEKWQEHTFIILAYKESKYLNNCIESILNQNITSNIIINIKLIIPRKPVINDKAGLVEKVSVRILIYFQEIKRSIKASKISHSVKRPVIRDGKVETS